MINFDDVTKENIKKHNPKGSKIPDQLIYINSVININDHLKNINN